MNDGAVNNADIIDQFSKGLFWNFNREKLDYIKHKDLIIERVIEAGLEEDEILMWRLYSYIDIKNVAVNMSDLLYDDLVYMSCVLNIKEEDFKCYGKTPWFRKC